MGRPCDNQKTVPNGKYPNDQPNNVKVPEVFIVQIQNNPQGSNPQSRKIHIQEIRQPKTRIGASKVEPRYFTGAETKEAV